jgi:hypothetical protein
VIRKRTAAGRIPPSCGECTLNGQETFSWVLRYNPQRPKETAWLSRSVYKESTPQWPREILLNIEGVHLYNQEVHSQPLRVYTLDGREESSQPLRVYILNTQEVNSWPLRVYILNGQQETLLVVEVYTLNG